MNGKFSGTTSKFFASFAIKSENAKNKLAKYTVIATAEITPQLLCDRQIKSVAL
jgi:hypothetical protein